MYMSQVLAVFALSQCSFSLSFRMMGRPPAEETNSVDDGNLFFKMAPPEVVSVGLGSTLELECEVAGSPSPTIHWLYNGQIIAQSANSIEEEDASVEDSARNRQMVTLNLGSTKSKLILECMTPDQEGEYTCVSDIPKDRISSSSLVQVEYKASSGMIGSPCMAKRQGGVASPARIFMWTSQRLEVEGADVQLFCRATGYPTPSITWQDRNGTPLGKSSDQYQVLPNGDLVIHNIDFMENMGMYKCVARNNVGEDEQGAFLYPTTLGK